MYSETVTVNIDSGVHARPAAMFVKLANRFHDAEIYVEKENAKINGKSVMGLMILALNKGTVITISAEGSEEEQAVKELADLVRNDFDREDLVRS